MKLTVKDKIVLRLIKAIQGMGYGFYTRKMVDNPRFNGDDIAMFYKPTWNGDKIVYEHKIIGISGGAVNADRMNALMIGKV